MARTAQESKNIIGQERRNNCAARPAGIFVHFLTYTAKQEREITKFNELTTVNRLHFILISKPLVSRLS